MIYLPMSDDTRTGVLAEVTYNNVPFGMKWHHSQQFVERSSWAVQKWLNISVSLMLSGFIAGIDFGFDAFNDWTDDKAGIFASGNWPLAKNDFNINIKFGGMIPFYYLKSHDGYDWGIFNFSVIGTYNITGADYQVYSYNPFTIGIGLSFLFNLEGF